MRALALAAAALGLAGCLEVLGPDVGPANQDTACTVEDSDPTTDVSFEADLRTGILDQRCSRCHTPGGDNPIGISRGGLDMSTYATLRMGGVRSGAEVIVDGDPCDSILRQKLDSPPPFGDRMPLNASELSAEEKQTISDWIVEGARDN